MDSALAQAQAVVTEYRALYGAVQHPGTRWAELVAREGLKLLGE